MNARRAPAACSCTRPRCPAAGSARTPTRSSTGWPPPARRGGRCCRSGRPTATARPTRRRRRSRPGRGCWPSRGRAVSRDEELDASASATAYWIDGLGALRPAAARVADQVRFDREWAALRAYAAERGVRLIGDVPIYVAPGGADQRAHPELFRDGARRRRAARRLHRQGPAVGQPALRLAGAAAPRLPLVGRAAARARSSSSTSRASTTSAASSPTGRSRRARATRCGGRWKRGPGARRVRRRRARARRELPLIAEDLGVITPAGRAAARRRSASPAWSCCSSASTPATRTARTGPRTTSSTRRLHGHPRQRHAARLVGRPRRRPAAGGPARSRRPASTRREVWWSLVRLAFGSRPRLAMVQAQDVLGLGSEARMNVPGRTGGNWRWRLEAGQLGDREAEGSGP